MTHTHEELIQYLTTNRPDIPASNWKFYDDEMLEKQCKLVRMQIVEHINRAIEEDMLMG